jgi:hypothetical protein
VNPLLAAAAAAGALALGGCGGDDGLPVDEYRSQLDAACEGLSQEMTRIPQVVQDEGLEIEDAQELADEAGREFLDDVQALEPPEELADAHEELLSGVEEAPDDAAPEAARERALHFADLYEALGAEGCAAGQRGVARLITRSIRGE